MESPAVPFVLSIGWLDDTLDSQASTPAKASVTTRVSGSCQGSVLQSAATDDKHAMKAADDTSWLPITRLTNTLCDSFQTASSCVCNSVCCVSNEDGSHLGVAQEAASEQFTSKSMKVLVHVQTAVTALLGLRCGSLWAIGDIHAVAPLWQKRSCDIVTSNLFALGREGSATSRSGAWHFPLVANCTNGPAESTRHSTRTTLT